MSAASASAGSVKAFVARLHFYAGLLVAPFLLVAAITGTLYVLTPQIEDIVYRDALVARTQGEARPLAEQAAAARAMVGPDLALFAVRPAPEAGRTTRVMFADPSLGESQTRAIFVDPASLAVQGDMTVYGTSGILPLRTTLDLLHRNLLLGDLGRLYSELAASWLWVVALGGLFLFAWRRTGRAARANPANATLRTRRRHGLAGVTLLLGLVFLSATGLTWSQWAGGRIDALRGAAGWVTPSVTLALAPGAAAPAGEHAHHGHGDPALPMPPAAAALPPLPPADQLDAAYRAAREGGLDSPYLEIRLPRPEQAWLVREYDRSWPTQVDTIALDPETFAVTSRADFETFPVIAKLVRWGIDAHMGVLFGWPNQLLMAAIGLGLVYTVVQGYRIWWRNRPAPGAPPRTLVLAWTRMSPLARGASAVLAAALGWALPVLGASLVAFLAIDLLRWRLAGAREGAPKRAGARAG